MGKKKEQNMKNMIGMMGRIEKAIYLLRSNPWQLLKIIYARLLPLPKSPIQKRINGVLFEFDCNLDPGIKNMFYGSYEISTIETIKKILKKGDVFIDVGANIGYVSAIALGVVGKEGSVHSFEPVPKYFNRLKNIAVKNLEYIHVANQYALGEREGTAKISVTNLDNIGWNTMVPGGMSDETTKEKIEVPVKRLDVYIKEKSLGRISLIKIDTEGFEFPVLKGLSDYFENTVDRPVIICEIGPGAYPLLGYTLTQLSQYMRKYGYRVFDINDVNKEINIANLKTTMNVLFKAV